MRKIQILKANHFSKNGVIIAVDRDTVALPSVDKNSKITKLYQKSIKNQINHFINT